MSERHNFGLCDNDILASHPMAAPLKPRTSTLRVRTICWKQRRHWTDEEQIFAKLERMGAFVSFGYSSANLWELPKYTIFVTWPEARK